MFRTVCVSACASGSSSWISILHLVSKVQSNSERSGPVQPRKQSSFVLDTIPYHDIPCVQFVPRSEATSSSERGCLGTGVSSRESGCLLGCVDVGSETVCERGKVVCETSERGKGSEVCSGIGAENVQVGACVCVK